MKILHCADLHIRENDIEEIDGCLSMIIRSAREECVDLAVIAGDIFDSRDIKLDSRSALMAVGFVSALADVCPVAIVIGTPSHDGNAPAIMRHARGAHLVKVADKPEQWMAKIGDGETVITLIPQPTKQFFQTASDIRTADQEIGQAMSGLFAGFGAKAAVYKAPHILVGHWNVSGARLSTGQALIGQDIALTVDQMDLSHASLHLLGHIHKAQQIGERTFYAGGIYRTNCGEIEPKGFWIHELLPIAASRFIETPCKKVLRFQEDFTGDVSLDHFLNTVAADVRGVLVRCDFKVWQDNAAAIDKKKIEAFFMQGGAIDADIRIIRIPRENVRAEAVLKAERLREKIVRMAEMREEEVSWSTLTKAEALEDRNPDELIEMIGRAA